MRPARVLRELRSFDALARKQLKLMFWKVNGCEAGHGKPLVLLSQSSDQSHLCSNKTEQERKLKVVQGRSLLKVEF